MGALMPKWIDRNQVPTLLVPGATEPLAALVASTMRGLIAHGGPRSPASLERAAQAALVGLDVPQNLLRATRRELISLGDLVLWSAPGNGGSPLLHAVPLCAVHRPAGGWQLVGVNPAREQALQAASAVVTQGAGRLIPQGHDDLIRELGLPNIDEQCWARAPHPESLVEAAQDLPGLLAGAPPIAHAAEPTLLIPGPGWYPHASPAPAHEGHRVAVTTLPWGQRRWWAVHVNAAGAVAKALELPQPTLPAGRHGFEQAWTLHIALAHAAGMPCGYTLADGLLELCFPAPPWLARRLDLRGERFEGVQSWLIEAPLQDDVRALMDTSLYRELAA